MNALTVAASAITLTADVEDWAVPVTTPGMKSAAKVRAQKHNACMAISSSQHRHALEDHQ